MDIGLGVAGLTSVLLAAGHEAVRIGAVLPAVTEKRLPGTRFLLQRCTASQPPTPPLVTNSLVVMQGPDGSSVTDMAFSRRL